MCVNLQICRKLHCFFGKIYTADENFTRPLVATVATNSKSVYAECTYKITDLHKLQSRSDCRVSKYKYENCNQYFSRVVDGSPECFCPSGWSGDRCHLRQDSNSPLPQPQDPNQDGALLLNVSVAHLEVLVLVLAATSLALLLLVVALAVVIFRLKQRPRIIRKR